MPMVRVSNGGTSQGNPPTTEIFKAVSTSNTAPVIVPTFGHNLSLDAHRKEESWLKLMLKDRPAVMPTCHAGRGVKSPPPMPCAYQ